MHIAMPRSSLPLVVLACLLPWACGAPDGDGEGGSGDGGVPSGVDGAPDGSRSASDAGSSADGARPLTSSKGKGGVTCERVEALVATRTSCVATLDGLEVKLAVGQGASGPLRLALYLHGDGAGAHQSGSALRVMLDWADAHDGLAVSVRAPNGCAWWQTPAHDCDSPTAEPDLEAENAVRLARVMGSIRAAYDVRDDAVFYYGSSGGSIFLTEEWIPLHGGEHPGVFALNCGGRPPTQEFRWDTSDEGARAASRFAFTYGDQDFLAADIAKTKAAFEARRLHVTEKVLLATAHCAFDGHGRAVEVWTEALEGR